MIVIVDSPSKLATLYHYCCNPKHTLGPIEYNLLLIRQTQDCTASELQGIHYSQIECIHMQYSLLQVGQGVRLTLLKIPLFFISKQIPLVETSMTLKKSFFKASFHTQRAAISVGRTRKFYQEGRKIHNKVPRQSQCYQD